MENQCNFGGIEREQKEQDVLLGSFAPVATRPATYMPSFNGVIEMQAKTPSCGAHAGQALKQVLENFEGSPEFLWKEIRLADKLTPNDGSTGDTIMQVLKKTGICSIKTMPNNYSLSNKDYVDPSTLTPDMVSEALQHTISTYAASWNPTWEQLKQAIYDHKAVIMLLRVGAEFWTPSWLEKDILPLKTNIPITSAHWVVAYAYDENYIYFINSWSSAWGRNGIGYFAQDYMSRCVEILTAVNSEAKYIFTKTLKLGSKGFDVKQLQLKLGITADGYFGPLTKQTVIKFQLEHSLVGDGIAGPLTFAKLS